ncbi:substrate-binding domain-containing protein [Streptomyces sp. NBC_01622]|uniref:substrate-binding domain-containing protein n=1 Tax=Streptomyces sp. NBC_01622 TaxID=2975903 RepID=UPI0038706AC0|nr:substrate-binding domain-containing protein [Streptomyces sp. NBC_01622]
MRWSAIRLTVCAAILSLAGCGTLNPTSSSGDTIPVKGDNITVGVLMPEKSSTRYDQFDVPIIKKKVASLTDGHGKVAYANAASDAGKQTSQMEKMITDGVDVIVLDAVDAHAIAGAVRNAKAAGIPVIAYERLAEGPVDGYVTFDNAMVGEVQGRSLVEALGAGIDPSAKVVMLNGSPSDPNARQFEQGAVSEMNGRVTVVASYDIKDWSPRIAQTRMTQALAQYGAADIAAVYAANDAMAAGALAAYRAAGVTAIPPITGQDAELAAIQRLLTGEQYMTVYKPYADEAETAAEAAVTKIQGRSIEFDAIQPDTVDSPTDKGIPANFVSVAQVTKEDIKNTVVADGIYQISDICTAKYKPACKDADLI